MPGFLSSVFWGLLTLSILVFVHEGGHFLAARLFNIRVTEFFLGMPSKIKLSHKSKTRGTEIGITPILLGGYTRVCGMEGNLSKTLSSVLSYVYKYGRINVMDAAHDLNMSEEEVYKDLITLVDWASIEPFYDCEKGESPTDKNWPKSFQTVDRDANYLTAFDKGHTDLVYKAADAFDVPYSQEEFLELEKSKTYQGKGFWKRFCVLFAGPLVNLVVGVLLILLVLTGLGLNVPANINKIGQVQQDSVASVAGIKAGDTILSVDGSKTDDFISIGKACQDALKKGENFTVEGIHDNGEAYLAHVVIEGKDVDALGVVATTQNKRFTVKESLVMSMNYTTKIVQFASKLLIPTQTKEVLDSSSSVVGISVMASQAASQGLREIGMFCASISMSLAVMNLLPIPPLDGGKILIEAIGAIRRKPLSIKAQSYISYAGLAFFMFIFIYALRLDILRFVLR